MMWYSIAPLLMNQLVKGIFFLKQVQSMMSFFFVQKCIFSLSVFCTLTPVELTGSFCFSGGKNHFTHLTSQLFPFVRMVSLGCNHEVVSCASGNLLSLTIRASWWSTGFRDCFSVCYKIFILCAFVKLGLFYMSGFLWALEGACFAGIIVERYFKNIR